MRSLVAMNLLLSLYHEGLTTNLRKLSSEECIRENERRGMLFQGRGSFGDDGRICRLFMRQFSSCLGRFGPQGFIGKKLRDKARVKRMAGLVSDNERAQRAAEKSKIPDEVEGFVAAKLVGEAEAAFEEAVRREHDGVFERAAADQSHAAELFDVFGETESARGSEFAAERFAADHYFSFLATDERMPEIHEAAYAEFVGGINAQSAIAFGDFKGLQNFQIAAPAAKLAHACAIEQVHVRLRGAVQDWQLEGVDLDIDVVDAAGIESGEEMLGGREKNAAFHQASCVTDAGNVAAVSFDFKIVEVRAPENDACVCRRRNQANMRAHGCMQADALNFNRLFDCELETHWPRSFVTAICRPKRH